MRFVAQAIGVLFIRSLRLADDIYLAMVSRSIDHDMDINTDSPRSLAKRDYVWITFVIVILGVLI